MNPSIARKPLDRNFTIILLMLGAGLLHAAPDTASPDAARSQFLQDYQGRPFDDAAYRAAQQVEYDTPRQPYRAFTPALVVWDGTSTNGTGWVGKEDAGASIQVDASEPDGRRLVHYHVSLSNYRYAAFGWQWGNAGDKPVDLPAYDAISFSIKVTGPRKPQELFFGVSESQPAPVSLREHDPDFADGSWHRITIPVKAMKWTGPLNAQTEVREFVFKTFVWDPADFDVWLDQLTFERAVPSSAQTVKPGAPTLSSASGQVIPGMIQCAFYDVGGEGVAYHDTTPINTLS